MFLLPKSVWYLCPYCLHFFKERAIHNVSGYWPTCPKCGTMVSQDRRVYPRRVRVRCPAPLCGLVQTVAVPIHPGSFEFSCSRCEAPLHAREHRFPRLPIRIVEAGARAVGRAVRASWRASRFIVRSSWKAGVFAVCSPFRAARAVAVAPFHAAASVGRWAFNLPFAVLERYLRARLDYRALDLAQIVSTLREPKAPVVIPPATRFIPQTFPAAPCALDDLMPGDAKTVETRNGTFVGKVVRHQIFFDEELFDERNNGEREFFLSRCNKPDSLARFDGDQMLVQFPYGVLVKRIWAEVAPRSNLPPETASRFLEETSVDVEIQCCREARGILSHFYRREINCSNIVVPGDRCLRIRVRPPYNLIQNRESIAIRFIIDGVVLQAMGRVQR